MARQKQSNAFAMGFVRRPRRNARCASLKNRAVLFRAVCLAVDFQNTCPLRNIFNGHDPGARADHMVIRAAFCFPNGHHIHGKNRIIKGPEGNGMVARAICGFTQNNVAWERVSAQCLGFRRWVFGWIFLIFHSILPIFLSADS